MSNLVEILVTAKNLTGPTMAVVNAEVDKTSKAMKVLNQTAMLAAAGFVAIGVESVKMAKTFDSDMTLLQTQAGVSKDKIGGLEKGVLSLAGQVGQNPDSLAASLFHVESNFESMGISSKKALDLTATSAKGAAVGHANLVDVTNALTAAVASGIPGVQNYNQAMGVLNATVGVGDMSMQDLAKAFSNGMIATVKGFGLSISDVGAALAVFGDNNIRGAAAATQLRMSVQALAKPVSGGAAALKSIGLQTDTLAKDMQQGGLKQALQDLVAHMNAAGISSKQQGQIITDAFGRKAGSGISILTSQLDRLDSKYPALAAGAKNFGKSWADTQKTFAQQVKELEAGFDALMISVGEKLIPPVQSFVHLLAEHRTAVEASVVALAGLAAATVAVAVAMKAVAAGKIVWSGITAGAGLAKTAMAALAREAVMAEAAFVTAGGGVKGLSAAFGALSTGAKLGVTVAAIGGLVLLLDKLSSSGKKAPDVDRMATALGNLAQTGKAGGELTAAFGKNLDDLSYAVGRVSGQASGMDKFNDTMNSIFTLGHGQSNSMKEAKQDIDSVDKGLAQLVTSGHADQASAALTKLAAAGVSIPTDKLDDYEAALASTALQSDLTAASQGRFGKQAEDTQADLKAQQDVADGLAQSLQALDQVNQDAYNSQTKFEDAISKATAALKTDGRTLDVHTEKGRDNRDALSALAAATDDYTANLTKQGKSWDVVDAAYERGYNSLVRAAISMGDSRKQADALANSLLHVPKDVKVGANIDDLESKLAKAKSQLKTVPSSKRASVTATIAQLESQIAKAKRELASVQSKTVSLNVVTTHTSKGSVAHEGGNYAAGGRILGPGSGTSDDVPIWASNGEYVVNAEAAKRNGKLLDAINGGRMLGFASGGKVTKSKAQKAAEERAQAEATARSSAMGGLTLSYFGSQVYKRNEFQSSTASPGSVGDLVGTLNQWRSSIKAATHGAEESKLVASFDKFGKAALKNETALTKVNSALSSAKDKLASLKDSFNDLKNSVSSNVVSGGSIVAQTGQPGGAASVISQLSGNVGEAKSFAADLAALKKKGLNAQSLSEIAQAGVSGGGLETAQRLMGSSAADVKTINSLEAQLKASGASAGSTAANSMYGAQINTAQALVTGLQKQQSKLDAVMEHAADAMAKQLKKALSRKATGGTVGAAATGGNRWGRTLVGEYAPEIVDLPIGSRVHSGPDSARMMSGGGSGWGGRPIELSINLGGQRVAKVLIDPLREEIRELGGNVQMVLGARR